MRLAARNTAAEITHRTLVLLRIAVMAVASHEDSGDVAGLGVWQALDTVWRALGALASRKQK